MFKYFFNLHYRHFLLLLFLSVCAILPASRVHAQTEYDAFGQLVPAAQEVALSINRVRAEVGLPPLAIRALLNQAAQEHVADMVTNRNFSHMGSDGSSVSIRVQRTGYPFDKAGASENWVSASTSAKAIEWWMNSWVHRNNIQNAKWRDLGVGVLPNRNTGRSIFVVVFAGASGQQRGNAVAPVATAQTPSIELVGDHYTVGPGDTLLGIGSRLGIDWRELAAENGLTENSVLNIGDTLAVPGLTAANDVTGNPTAGKRVVPDAYTDYAVQSGDTLMTIASRFGLTWEELAAINSLSGNTILQIGQKIQVPAQDAIPGSSNPAQHTVVTGDTVLDIAIRYGLGWKNLLAINGLNEDSLLQLGQVIRLR